MNITRKRFFIFLPACFVMLACDGKNDVGDCGEGRPEPPRIGRESTRKPTAKDISPGVGDAGSVDLDDVLRDAAPSAIANAKVEIERIARDSPEELIALLSIKDLFFDPDWMEFAASMLIAIHPEEIINLQKRIAAPDRRMAFLRGACRSLLKSGGPDAAVALLAKLPSGAGAGGLYGDLVREFGEGRLQKGIELLNDVDFKEGKNNVAAALIELISQSSGNKLHNLEQVLGTKGIDQCFQEQAATEWLSAAKSDFADQKSLLSAIQQLEVDDQVKALVVKSAAVEAVKDNPSSSAALDWLSVVPKSQVIEYTSAATAGIARRNVNEASQFVVKLTPDVGLDYCMQTLLATWLPSDSVAASEWINELPKGSPQRSAAIHNLVGYLRQVGDTVAADQWEKAK